MNWVGGNVFVVFLFVVLVVDEVVDGLLGLSEGTLDLPDVGEVLRRLGETRAVGRCVPFLLVCIGHLANGTLARFALTKVFSPPVPLLHAAKTAMKAHFGHQF